MREESIAGRVAELAVSLGMDSLRSLRLSEKYIIA